MPLSLVVWHMKTSAPSPVGINLRLKVSCSVTLPCVMILLMNDYLLP